MAGRRISRLEIENFKGFSDRISLDLDAELVLLVGPNGRGKTSTIEALELLVTGAVGQRIGDKSEFDLRDFIHCNRTTGERCVEAKVTATWKNDGSTDSVLIGTSSKAGPIASGPLAAKRQEQSSEAENELTRACTFLYSDSLGSLAGLELSARRKVIDFFVPSFSQLDALAAQQAPRLSSHIADALRRIETTLPDIQQLSAREVRQAAIAQDAWKSAGDDVHFVKKGPALLAEQNLKKAINKVCSLLGQEASSDSGDYQQQLRRISEAAAAKADALDAQHKARARATSYAHGAWVTVQSALRAIEQKFGSSNQPGLLSPATLIERRRALGDPNLLQARRLSLRAEQASSSQAVNALWQEYRGNDLPGGVPHIGIGTLPVLATLSKMEPSTPLPSWWKEVGLPQPDPDRFTPLFLKEAQRWRDLRAHLSELEKEILEMDAKQAESATLDKLAPMLEELSRAWSEAGRSDPLPTHPDGRLASEEIRRAVAEALETIAPTSIDADQQVVKWRAIADAFSAWADARVEVLDGAQQWAKRQELTSTHEQLQKLRKIVDYIGSDGRGCFKDVLRVRIADQKYQKVLNASLQQVLRWYAHRSDIASSSRIEFHRHGPLQVRVGPEDGDSTGIASLSRSQLTSIAFGLAIVANLGHPSLPTGFLCLDDVSDAFDLDNLAADAAMLRLLAYGANANGGNGHRQLILTNHNDELTDRIVPLLLPPAGRRMLIIEFVEEGPSKPIRVKQWAVQGEHHSNWERRSPLRALLPEASSGSATGH